LSVCARPPLRLGVPVDLDVDQREAIRRAVTGPLVVVSGGPGTGKTAIVVSILRVLERVRDARELVALAAPTGKAAHRMTSAIRAALLALSKSPCRSSEGARNDDPGHLAEAALIAAPPEAETLHRLLGYLPVEDRFRHDENNPIAASWVIVDEASMIDLEMFDRLLAALRPGARLILLGDADQLPSVDAGAVLRDLLALGRAGASVVQAVTLTRSYRMDPNDPDGRAILSAAHTIHAGDAAPLLSGDAATQARAIRRSAPRFLSYRGVEWLETSTPIELADFLDAWYATRISSATGFHQLAARQYRVERGHWSAADADGLRALLHVHEQSRLLAVTRGLPTGAGRLNRQLHARALALATSEGQPAFYPGEPVMMTRNDYDRGLYNGDQGVIVRVVESGGPQRFRAVFSRSGGELAAFHLDPLRASLELAYASTVHKSQGTELDTVAIILPVDDVPLLTRELIYTAITRARRSVIFVGSRARLRDSAARTIERDSGLADRVLPPP
jgi:exodeoxyribonuclease V alpha subunit